MYFVIVFFINVVCPLELYLFFFFYLLMDKKLILFLYVLSQLKSNNEFNCFISSNFRDNFWNESLYIQVINHLFIVLVDQLKEISGYSFDTIMEIINGIKDSRDYINYNDPLVELFTILNIIFAIDRTYRIQYELSTKLEASGNTIDMIQYYLNTIGSIEVIIPIQKLCYYRSSISSLERIIETIVNTIICRNYNFTTTIPIYFIHDHT